MCRNGFWQSVGKIVAAEGIDCDEICARTFRPDAYLIDNDRKEINIFEVEVTHAMPETKMDDYAWWWFLWECEGQSEFLPRLFVVDRYGHGSEMDLRQLYYHRLLEKHAHPERLTV
jgi:hypothetical protein